MSLPAPFVIREATRRQSLARVAFEGPAGSGKTWDSLIWAFTLGERPCVIDTEHESASLYADEFLTSHGRRFSTLNFEPPYTPDRLMQAIAYVQSQGHDVVVIDSLSHFWSGQGGVLEIVDAAAKRGGGNSWAGWKDATPMHREMIEAILGCRMHVIVTMRVKTEWSVEENDKGRKQPKKIGLAAEQRAGLDYEFTVAMTVNLDHEVAVVKTRCARLADRTARKERVGEMAMAFNEWLREAKPASPPALTVVPDQPAAAAPTLPTPPPPQASVPTPPATEPVVVAPEPASAPPSPAANTRLATSGVAPAPPTTATLPDERKPVDVACPGCGVLGTLFARSNPPAGKEFFCARSVKLPDGTHGCNQSFSTAEVEDQRAKAAAAVTPEPTPPAETADPSSATVTSRPTIVPQSDAAPQVLSADERKKLANRTNRLPAACRLRAKTFQALCALGYEAADACLSRLEALPDRPVGATADDLGGYKPTAAQIEEHWLKGGLDATIAFLDDLAAKVSGPEADSAASA